MCPSEVLESEPSPGLVISEGRAHKAWRRSRARNPARDPFFSQLPTAQTVGRGRHRVPSAAPWSGVVSTRRVAVRALGKPDGSDKDVTLALACRRATAAHDWLRLSQACGSALARFAPRGLLKPGFLLPPHLVAKSSSSCISGPYRRLYGRGGVPLPRLLVDWMRNVNSESRGRNVERAAQPLLRL